MIIISLFDLIILFVVLRVYFKVIYRYSVFCNNGSSICFVMITNDSKINIFFRILKTMIKTDPNRFFYCFIPIRYFAGNYDPNRPLNLIR